MKYIAAIAALVVLSGCGVANRQARDAAVTESRVYCSSQNFKKKLAYTSCMEQNYKGNIAKSGLTATPDEELMFAKFKVLAEKLDKKQITQNEYDLETQQFMADLNNKEAALQAQQRAAYNAGRPRYCNSYVAYGQVHTNCY